MTQNKIYAVEVKYDDNEYKYIIIIKWKLYYGCNPVHREQKESIFQSWICFCFNAKIDIQFEWKSNLCSVCLFIQFSDMIHSLASIRWLSIQNTSATIDFIHIYRQLQHVLNFGQCVWCLDYHYALWVFIICIFFWILLRVVCR